MARESQEIRHDIAETRQEIDEHLRELGGEVRTELSVERQTRRNLPQVLIGAAIAGLFFGILVGRGGGYEKRMRSEQARLAREWMRLARERGRMGRMFGGRAFEGEQLSDIP